jgi:cyclin-dependent kinase 4
VGLVGPDRAMENYRVLCKIGSGAYGRVFHACHVATKVDYAIKRIRCDRQGEPGISSSTLREISMIKSLQRRPHENIVELVF